VSLPLLAAGISAVITQIILSATAPAEASANHVVGNHPVAPLI